MLATVILDSFTRAEASDIAAALDDLCSPDDNYGFASAGLYAFWSVPSRDILYVGLASELRRRFRQHTGLVACDADCCKRTQIEAYFQSHSRLGYTVIVQSPMEQPVTDAVRQQLTDLYDDAFAADVSSMIRGDENVRIAEGFVLELHRKLGDRLPPWNKVHGAKEGRNLRSLSSDGSNAVRSAVRTIRTGQQTGEIEAELAGRHPPYELLLNLTGYELSGLNAKATLREISADATFGGHEEFLHGVRMLMLMRDVSFSRAVALQLAGNPYAPARVHQMTEDGYLLRTPNIPGVGCAGGSGAGRSEGAGSGGAEG